MSDSASGSPRAIRGTLLRLSRKLFGWPPVAPPHEVKRDLIVQQAKKHGLNVLVETGTFKGEMLECQLANFKQLISVELDEELYRAARARFAAHPQVQLLQGDSGVKLAEAIKDLKEPALFWLDAHYSFGLTAGRGTDAPIFKELSCLTGRQEFRDAILIDVARLFGWDFGYPSLRKVKRFVASHWPERRFYVESDIICIVPAIIAGQ
jgi:hypothetical protein